MTYHVGLGLMALSIEIDRNLPAMTHLESNARQPASILLWGLLMVLAALPFVNSFDGPFIFDDLNIVDQNQFMRSLWPIGSAMEAPRRSTAAGRPIVAYTYAINYAISEMDEWSYHALNLLVHLLNTAMVFGILRWVLRWRVRSTADPRHATALAWLIALLWAVHPLNAETVIYIAQRNEMLLGMFGLAALGLLILGSRHGAGRLSDQPGAQPVQTSMPTPEQPSLSEKKLPGAGAGAGQTSLAVQLGVVVLTVFATLCKETAVVFPLLILLFDRAFLAGDFRSVWRRRGLMYVAMLLPIAVAIHIATGDHRGGLITGDADVTWRYLLTQAGVILHYLRLSVVPYPLAVTYDWPLVKGLVDSLPASLIVLGLVLWMFFAVVRQPKLGFALACFFAILAPTSSVIPIMTEVVAERRMYLPLLPVLVLGVLGVWKLMGMWSAGAAELGQRRGVLAGFLLCFVVVCGGMTWVRSFDFDSKLTIWDQTVRVQPRSTTAKNNYGAALVGANRYAEAERMFRDVLAISPNNPRTHHGMGMVYFHKEQWDRASDAFLTEANKPDGRPADYAYAALSFAMAGKDKAAEHAIQTALRMNPNDSQTLNFAAVMLDRQGRTEEAIAAYRYLIELYPESAMARSNLAHSLGKVGRIEEARQQFRSSYALFPDSYDILNNYANYEAQQENFEIAAGLFRTLTEQYPDDPMGWTKLGVCLTRIGADDEAEAIFSKGIVLHPDHVATHQRYVEWLLDTKQNWPDAERIVEHGLRTQPGDPGLKALEERIDAIKRADEEAFSVESPVNPQLPAAER